MTKLLVAALAVASVAIPSAWGTKPPSGSSTGTGSVFLPNPVADLQNESLTDQKDADYAALQAAYHTVTLTNLDGSGYLRGDWANVVSETGNPAYSPTNTFIYNRNDDEFEQVMAYYWITRGAEVHPEPWLRQRRCARQHGVRRTSASTSGVGQLVLDGRATDELRFGKGGVDDAEDAEVILHEYGHAIHDSQDSAFGAARPARSARGSATTGPSPSPTSSHRPPTRRASPTGTRSRTRRRCRTASGASTRTCTTRRI